MRPCAMVAAVTVVVVAVVMIAGTVPGTLQLLMHVIQTFAIRSTISSTYRRKA